MFNKLNEILLISQGVSTMNYFKDVINDGPIKAFTCLSAAFISWLLGTFTPLWTILFIIFLLILTDMILGCKVSLINNSKLESRKFWKTLRKFCWCCAIIWFSHEIDKDISDIEYTIGKYNAEIINADAVQVFKDFNIEMLADNSMTKLELLNVLFLQE